MRPQFSPLAVLTAGLVLAAGCSAGDDDGAAESPVVSASRAPSATGAPSQAKPSRSASAMTAPASTASRPASSTQAPSPARTIVSPKARKVTPKTYRNARFGFQATYPGSWKLTESANGDGATMDNRIGTTMKVWGQNVGGHLAEKNHLDEIKRAQKAGYRITYDYFDWTKSVITGTRTAGPHKGDILYRHTRIGHESAVVVEWVYPVKHQRIIDPWVRRTAINVRPGDLEKAH